MNRQMTRSEWRHHWMMCRMREKAVYGFFPALDTESLRAPHGSPQWVMDLLLSRHYSDDPRSNALINKLWLFNQRRGGIPRSK